MLPALGGDASARRLMDDVVDLRDRNRARTLVALQGLRAFEGLSGKTRYELMREIVKRFEGLENAARDNDSSDVERWRSYSLEVLSTLRELATSREASNY